MAFRIRKIGRRPRLAMYHRGRRRCRSLTGNGGFPDLASGSRCTGEIEYFERCRFPSFDRADAGRCSCGDVFDRESGSDQRRALCGRPSRSSGQSLAQTARTISFGSNFYGPGNKAAMIGPGKTIGIFGGGQLGRMTAIEARKMGYQIHVYEPSKNPPAGETADFLVTAPYKGEEPLKEFLKEVDVATFEFENIPAELLHKASERGAVQPSPDVSLIWQKRARRKLFIAQAEIPQAAFAVISWVAEPRQVVKKMKSPS